MAKSRAASAAKEATSAANEANEAAKAGEAEQAKETTEKAAEKPAIEADTKQESPSVEAKKEAPQAIPPVEEVESKKTATVAEEKAQIAEKKVHTLKVKFLEDFTRNTGTTKEEYKKGQSTELEPHVASKLAGRKIVAIIG